jgi:hypothetical protein
MNSINNETPDILLKDHYYDLIEKLVEDIEQPELIQSFSKKYIVKNPSFLKKLKIAACNMAIKENTHWHTDKMINDDESAILGELTSVAFQNNNSHEIERAQVKLAKIEADNTEENSIIFVLPYTRLYLTILDFIIQDNNKIEDEGINVQESAKEKIFKYPYVSGKDENKKDIIESIEFSIRERLALLKIFQSSKLLEENKEWYKDSDNEYNNRYKIFLSIIMGIPPSSFKIKSGNALNEDFWVAKTETQKKTKRISLAKIFKVTNKVNKQTDLKLELDEISKKLGYVIED